MPYYLSDLGSMILIQIILKEHTKNSKGLSQSHLCFCYNNLTPDAMSAIIKNNDNIKRYQLRKKLKIDVPRFNTNYMRNSVARRGAIVWNTLVPQLNDDIDNVKKYAIMARRSKTLLHLDFDCISPQTLTRWEEDFKYN